MIAKKLNLEDADGGPIPGSLEEDLASPDKFFEARHKPEPAQSDRSHFLGTAPLELPSWRQLAPMDIFARAQVEQMYRTHVQFAEDRQNSPEVSPGKGRKSYSNSVYKEGSGKDAAKLKKPKVKLMDASDHDIRSRYRDIGTKLTQSQFMASTASLTTGFRNSKSLLEFGETRQERFFDAHATMQKEWGRYFYRTCADIGRKPFESVVARAEGYREKVEKAYAMEMTNPTALIYGSQGWYLSLRYTPKFKDTRHYALPIGKDYNGLWMQITENPHKPEIIVRSQARMPQKFRGYKDNPFVIEKQKQEAKLLSELIPVQDEGLDGLIVRVDE